MTKACKTSRLFGLLALLAGLMAFATAAQAEPGAYWEVGGTQIKDKTLLPEVNAKKDTPHIIFLTKSGLSTLEILCTEILLTNGLLHELGRTTGRIHFEGCITRLNGSEATLCKPHTPGAAEGLILTEPLEGLLKLHILETGGTEDVLLLLPVNAGMIILTLELGSGKCAIKGANITGEIVLKDCKSLLLINELEHLFEFHSLTKLLFGANPMTIDGSFWEFLTGAHKGQLWSGHPA
ncbi:MAG TPA: hypothetical protein VK513_15365 [Terriglobales bacterium]|nr:hypothetical protein [Terriglobales bacterium]